MLAMPSLTSGPINPMLTRLSIPMVWGIFSIVAFNVIDTFFVAQLGTDPLAALSFTFPVVLVFGSLALGLGNGAQSVISRAIGEGNIVKVRRYTSDGLSLGLLFVAVGVVIGLLTIRPLFVALGATPELLPLIEDYMVIWYSGVIFVVIPMVGNQAIRAAGDTRTPALIMLVAAIANAILDPIFIFGWGPIPRFEIKGAAYATVISRAMTLGAAVFVLHVRKKMLDFKRPPLKEAVASWLAILKVGVPMAASNMVVPLSMFVVTALVAKFGKEAVAGFGIASRLESLTFVVIMALASALGPFVGQNWGAGLYQRVHDGVKSSFRFAIFWGCLLAVILAVLGGSISALFNDDPQVVATAQLYLWIVPISYAFEGLRLVAVSTFGALGRAKYSAWVTSIRMILVYLPAALVLGYLVGLPGIFSAAVIANITAGFLAVYWSWRLCMETSVCGPANAPVNE